eukprot:IDg2080t1
MATPQTELFVRHDGDVDNGRGQVFDNHSQFVGLKITRHREIDLFPITCVSAPLQAEQASLCSVIYALWLFAWRGASFLGAEPTFGGSDTSVYLMAI